MHIAYVLKRYPRFSETFVVNEILAHEAAGVEVSIFALRPPADTHFQPAIARVRAPVTYLQYAGVRADEFWRALEPQLVDDRLQSLVDTADCNGIDVFQALQLAQALRGSGIDHIHAHFATSAATVARLASLITGIPYSLTAHAKDIYHEYVNSAGLSQKLADAAAVVTVTDYNQRHLANEFPFAGNKIHRIYNGLPLEQFPFTEPVDRPPVILGIGRLVEKKGFADLVSACSLLARHGVEYCCHLVGGGELDAALRQQIRDLGLESQVYLLGPLPSDQVVAALRGASILAAPCVTASTGDRDGLPTVLIEAMAVGTCCVATDVTGIPEVVRDEETGLLVSERSPEQLADSLWRLLTDQTLARRLAPAARELVMREFDVHRNASKLRDLFCSGRRQSLPVAQLAEAV